MKPLAYKLASTSRIVMITLTFAALAIVSIEAYINSTFDTVKVIVIVVLGLNILNSLLLKPKNPETNNAHPQIPGEAPDQKQGQV